MEKNIKRIMTVGMTVMLLFAISITTFAAGFTKQNAIDRSLADAGKSAAQVVSLKAEKDGRNYEVEFRLKKTGDKFEYKYDQFTGVLKEKV